jgi:hypothetical protein
MKRKPIKVVSKGVVRGKNDKTAKPLPKKAQKVFRKGLY